MAELHGLSMWVILSHLQNGDPSHPVAILQSYWNVRIGVSLEPLAAEPQEVFWGFIRIDPHQVFACLGI